MRFAERHLDRLERGTFLAERAGGDPIAHALADLLRQHLGRGVAAGELGQLVEIAVVERRQHALEQLAEQPDVDNDAVGVEFPPRQLQIDDEGGAVQPLRRAEHLALEAVRHHDVVADGHTEHAALPDPDGARQAPSDQDLANVTSP